MSVLILLISLAVFLYFGIPIAYSLGLSTLVYFGCVRPDLAVVLPQRLFAGMDSYALIALPLFILMGQLMNASGITTRLIHFCLIFVGQFRGGLGLVNVAASMLFGGISGSSASDTASIGSILIPEMEQRGYPKTFAAGITVASSTMGMIIPPSIPMVIYAVTAQVSVGKMFLGGLIPGLLIGIMQLGIVYWVSQRRQYPKEQRRSADVNLRREVLQSLYVLIMPIFVVGSVVGGFATATESAGLGVLYAALIGFFVTKHLTIARFMDALRYAALISAKIMLIIAFSQVFIWVLAYERVPTMVAEYVTQLELSPTVLMLLIAAIILAAGTFIDVSPAILLLTPVFLPAAISAGVSPILFGVVLVSGLAVGACTPPVGNCLNVCSAVSDLPIGKIFQGAFVFLLANVAILFLIVLFPQLVLGIPNLLME
jgi:tripartite ATP-independent transporter DctM subunit